MKNKLIFGLCILLFSFIGCFLLSSVNTQAYYEQQLNTRINKVDTTYFLSLYGYPKDKLGRTWQYYFEKIDNTYENKSYMPENYNEKDFEILIITFDEKGMFIDWDIMAYKKGLF